MPLNFAVGDLVNGERKNVVIGGAEPTDRTIEGDVDLLVVEECWIENGDAHAGLLVGVLEGVSRGGEEDIGQIACRRRV